ncbi:MAG TPA: DUF1294 domain-containing protein [Noviherbaspirillum sp.]
MHPDPLLMLGACAAWYAVLSIAAFVAYAADKSAARRGDRRTPERTLHLLALAGGWPGGMLARRMLRHKSRKPMFLFVLWASALLHVAALAWLGWLAFLQ